MRHLFLVGSVILSCCSAVQAQEPSAMDAARNELTTMKRSIIKESLPMDPEQSSRFWPLYSTYESELRRILDRELFLLGDFVRNNENYSDAHAIHLVQEAMRLNQDRVQVRMNFMLKVSKVLPGRLALRLFQLENKIEAAVDYKLAEQIPLTRPEQIKEIEAKTEEAGKAPQTAVAPPLPTPPAAPAPGAGKKKK